MTPTEELCGNTPLSFVILKHTSSLGDLIIKPVNKVLAREMVIKNHYSHRWNDGGFGVFDFGIFKAEEPDKCLGVAVFGYMKNVKAKIFTHPNPQTWMCELNRLWIDDCLGKNAETILISSSIRLIKKLDKNVVAIQSFADGRLGCGTIYKAANFRYYDQFYTIFLRHNATGDIRHQQNFTNSTNVKGYIRLNVGYLLGDYTVFRVKTYRYIYPIDNKFAFRGKERQYPAYDKGIENVDWRRDKQLIKKHIIRLLDEVV